MTTLRTLSSAVKVATDAATTATAQANVATLAAKAAAKSNTQVGIDAGAAQAAADEATEQAGLATAAKATAVAAKNTATDQAVIATDAATAAGNLTAVAVAALAIYATSAAGVAGGTGVAAGKYYYVPSTVPGAAYDVWQNVGGVATATGINLPNLAAVAAAQLSSGEQIGLAATTLNSGASNGGTINAGTLTLSILAAVTGASSFLAPVSRPGASVLALLVGTTIRLTTTFAATANFLAQKPPQVNFYGQVMRAGAPVNLSNANATLVSRTQTGNLLTVVCDYVVTGTDQGFGAGYQVISSAVVQAGDHTLQIVAANWRVTAAPAGSTSVATLQDRMWDARVGAWWEARGGDAALTKPFSSGDVSADATMMPQFANGSVTRANGAGRAVGYTIPAGSTGLNTVMQASYPFNGAAYIGRTIKVVYGFDTSAGYARTLTKFFQVNRAAGAVNRSATVTDTPVGSRRVITYTYVIQGDETALQPYHVVTGGAAVADEFALLSSFSLEVTATTSDVKTPPEETLELREARNLSAINAAVLSSLHSGIGSVIAESGAAPQAFNGASVIAGYDGRLSAISVAVGTIGNTSLVQTKFGLAGTTSGLYATALAAAWAGATVRVSVLYDTSAVFTRILGHALQLVTVVSGTANAFNATTANGRLQSNVEVTALAGTSFTGSIADNIMTVTVAGANPILIGHRLSGAGVAFGTRVGKQLTGTAGGVGTYVVNKTQTVASTAIAAAPRIKASWLLNVFGDEVVIQPFCNITSANVTPTAAVETLTPVDMTVDPLTSPAYLQSPMEQALAGVNARAQGVASATVLAGALQSYAVVVTVKADGTGNYTHPKLALDAITDASFTKRYNVVIYPGVYDQYVNWENKNYVDLTGTSRRECVIHYEYPDNQDGPTIGINSTMYLRTNTTLRNLTITCKNARYAIHLETSGVGVGTLQNIINCDVEHKGNYTAVNNTWAVSSQLAIGSGLSGGEVVTMRESTFRGPGGGFSYHTNANFVAPSVVDAESCHFACTDASVNCAFRILPIGSKQSDRCRLVGNSFSGGDVVYGWGTNNGAAWQLAGLVNQPAMRNEVEVYGHSNRGACFRNASPGRALKIESNTTGAASQLTFSGALWPVILGDGTTLKYSVNTKGSAGLKGYVAGWGDISGTVAGTDLASRLGNRTGAPIAGDIVVDGGAPQTVTLAANYSAMTNAQVIAAIQAQVIGATLSNYAIDALYQGTFTDQEYMPRNETAAGILRRTLLAWDTTKGQNVRPMTAADPVSLFAGVALEDMPAGTARRVFRHGFLMADRLERSDALALVLGDGLSISATGMVAKDNTKPVATAIRSTAVEMV